MVRTRFFGIAILIIGQQEQLIVIILQPGHYSLENLDLPGMHFGGADQADQVGLVFYVTDRYRARNVIIFFDDVQNMASSVIFYIWPVIEYS